MRIIIHDRLLTQPQPVKAHEAVGSVIRSEELYLEHLGPPLARDVYLFVLPVVGYAVEHIGRALDILLVEQTGTIGYRLHISGGRVDDQDVVVAVDVGPYTTVGVVTGKRLRRSNVAGSMTYMYCEPSLI